MAARTLRVEMDFSAKAFSELVWPEICVTCGGGTLRMVDESDDLDTRGGIDAYQSFKTGIRTMAVRVQRVDDYDKPSTFTIRSRVTSMQPTELDKRLAALARGDDLPSLTIQAYVNEARRVVTKVGIVHTRPFYAWILTSQGVPVVEVMVGRPPRTEWPPFGVTKGEPVMPVQTRLVPLHFTEKTTRADGNRFIVVPWGDVRLYSDVPMVTCDSVATCRSGNFPDGWPDERLI